MNKTTALFDCDGTLVDSTHVYEKVALELSAERGIDLTAEDCRLFSGKPPAVWLRLKGAPEAAIEPFCAEYSCRARALLGESKWFPGAREMLETLAAEGRPRAIITTARGKSFAVINDALRITDLVPTVMLAEDVEPFYKPDPRGLHLAMERLGAEPEDCFYGGDNDVDMQAARAAGVLAIHIAAAHTSPHVRELADHVIDHPSQFLRFLRRRA